MSDVATILVGVDGGAPARRALEWALRRAATTGATVRAVWVEEGPAGAQEESNRRVFRAQLDAALEAAGLEGESVPPIEEVWTNGEVRAELRRAAEDADLLVIGTNFKPGVAGWFKGTRALSLAADSPVPLVVVPDVELTGRSGVVVGVDARHTAEATEAADRALAWAATEAAASGEPLELLQAAPIPAGSAPAYVAAGDLRADVVADAREAVDRLGRELVSENPGLTVRCRITGEWPVPALTSAGRDAALVVVGSRGLGALRRFLIGSVSSDVLLSLAGPVAVVR